MKLIFNHLYKFILLGCVPFICLACDNKKSEERSDSFGKEAATVMDRKASEEARIAKVVKKWNASLNNRDLKASNEVYADKVMFYTQEMSGEEATRLRIEAASQDPSWQQSIVTEIEISEVGDGLMEASFTKQSHSTKGVRTYPAYLYLRKLNGKWCIVKESDKITDTNVAKRTTSIPADAIRGDFDGDGSIDHVWIEGNFDGEGYAKGRLMLRSDRKNLEGLSWSAPRGVQLVNVSDLNNSNRDFLGAIPLADSDWTTYELYVWKGGKWVKALKPFSIWIGDDDTDRVWKADRKGYVNIKMQNMSGNPDTMFEPVFKTVKLNW